MKGRRVLALIAATIVVVAAQVFGLTTPNLTLLTLGSLPIVAGFVGHHVLARPGHESLEWETGLRRFALETHPERPGPHLDRYIQGEDVDPCLVLYCPWATEEYLELLDWMHGYNRARPEGERLTFHGIDPQDTDRDRRMARNISRLLDEAGPGSRVIVWAANSHIQGAAGGMGQYLNEEFGDDVAIVATADPAAGPGLIGPIPPVAEAAMGSLPIAAAI